MDLRDTHTAGRSRTAHSSMRYRALVIMYFGIAWPSLGHRFRICHMVGWSAAEERGVCMW